MSAPSREVVRFKRNHFAAGLPVRYRYSPSHFWMFETDPGNWRVGLTSFGTRMLGEIVEFDFEVSPGSDVHVGELMGWIEGFKAVSDLYCVVEGTFGGCNETATGNGEIICKDPYDEGWLYSVQGSPDPRATDVGGYVEHLNRTIDKMLEKPWRSSEVHES